MEGTTIGPNRTGGAMNADGIASMLEAVAELSPPMPVSTLLMDIERQWYITEAEAVGSIPPPISSPGTKGRSRCRAEQGGRRAVGAGALSTTRAAPRKMMESAWER